MKYMTMLEKYGRLNLQLFAEGGEGADGEDSGYDDDNEDDDDGGEPERKFTQADMDNAIKERLRREKRKWQREQQKKASGEDSDDEDKNGKDDKTGESEETKKLREKAARADELELKWICLEHGADKANVDDLIALAQVHASKNDSDIEDAIDEVLKKYPSFKGSASESDEDADDNKNKGWGQRQKGKPKDVDGVEAAFLKRNPGLKID